MLPTIPGQPGGPPHLHYRSVNISQYESIPVNISQYQSISVNISQYQSISVNISQYQSVGQSWSVCLLQKYGGREYVGGVGLQNQEFSFAPPFEGNNFSQIVRFVGVLWSD